MKTKSLTPWLVALACFGPFVVAMVIYYGPHDWVPRLPGARELVEPPVAVPAGWLEGSTADAGRGPYRWSLVYARMTPCEEQCVEDLERMSQVRGALGRDMDRAQRAFFYVGDPPPDLDGFLVRSLASPEGEALVDALGADRLASGRVYIADPRGYLVAGYPPDVGQRELLRDLKRLLGSRAD
jgi:hypothetical protein